MPDIEFGRNGALATGYLAVPASGQGLAAIVLQERWGLDTHIKSVCDRLATEGFFALAPDLRRGQTITPSGESRVNFSLDDAQQTLVVSVEHLLSISAVEGLGVGALGFGYGGGLAICAAAQYPQIAATVAYYGILPDGAPDYPRIAGPVLGHYGTADIFISLKDAKALELAIRRAGVEVEFEKYTGAGHAFFNDTSPLGTYDASAADRSWRRSVSFLTATLNPSRSPADTYTEQWDA
jgi:carboxymethylenebutenolidase